METNPPFSRVRAPPIPPTHKSQFTPLLIFLFLLTISTPTSSTQNQIPNFDQLYSQHCNDVVPKSDTHPKWFVSSLTLQDIGFHTGYFTGGDALFNRTRKTSGDDRKALTFRPNYVGKTQTHEIFRVKGNIDLQSESIRDSTRRNLKLIIRGPRIPIRRGMVSFRVDGFYSEDSKRSCMIGKSMPIYNAGDFKPSVVVVKLNYPKWSSVYDTLVSGSLSLVSDKSLFDDVLMLGFMVKPSYQYTFVGEDRLRSFPSSVASGESIHLRNLGGLNDSNRGLCRLLVNRLERYDLVYGSECFGGVNCNPLGRDVGYVPGSLVFYGTRCIQRKMQMLLGFVNSSVDEYVRFSFVPSTTFVAEGEWDEKGNRLCAVACRILNFTESLTSAVVGDCSTKFILRFPARLSLRNRSALVGEFWSDNKVSDPGYFSKIRFQGLSGWLVKLLAYKYEYSVSDNLRKTCLEKRDRRVKRKKYPEEYSSDMKFDMKARNSKGQVAWGYSSPLFVDDDWIYGRWFWEKSQETEKLSRRKKSHGSPMNMSYKLSFTHGAQFFHDVFPFKAELAAEGIYDRDYGNLCMIGCRHIPSKEQILLNKDMLDCSVKIDVHFPPLDTKDGRYIKGTMGSTRNKSDPLYFEPIEFSSASVYHNQAAASITRIDFEIVMVLMSNTLACAFVGWQLYFVKKNPDVHPFTSIVMLIVLTLGYAIPLLFNFEAMLAPNQSRQSTFLGLGGWLQVNEVMVRVMMLVILILLLLLLQLTWSSRQGHSSQKSLTDSERKVLYTTLPLYIAGALITCSVHHWMSTHRPFHRKLRRVANLWHLVHRQRSLWDDLKSYGGFILDGFLLPQILFNLFANSGEKALSCSFYFGTTMIRLLPHAYDLYRARTYTWLFAFSYIYANPKTGFFSTAWNIIIPCCCLLFAAIIFLQQRFGGRCLLPTVFRHVYEKVPVISNEEL